MPIALTDLYKQPEIQKRAEQSKTIMGIKDLVDRGILIKSFEIINDKNLKGEDTEFCQFTFELGDDDKHLERKCRTQSWKIKQVLMNITNEELQKQGGIYTMIVAQKTPNGNSYQFAGVKP